MNRRRFLSNTGILLAGLGVVESFKYDLLEKLGRQLLPEADATTGGPIRMLELCLRQGIPMIQFGTGQEFTQLSQPTYSNFAYSGSQAILGTGTTNLYLSPDSAPLAPHAANIAITQGIDPDGPVHTETFNVRKGSMAMNLTSPIIELSALNSTASLVNGVQWPSPYGPVQNTLNTFLDLTQLNQGSSDYLKLFEATRLQMTNPQLATVLQAAGQLSMKQAAVLESQLQNANNQASTQNAAGQLFAGMTQNLTDYSTMGSGLTSTAQVNHPTGCCGADMTNYVDIRDALKLSLNGFKYNAINSALVTIDMGDWHSMYSTTATGQVVGPITNAVSQTLADTIAFLKATPEPTQPGKTLWDTTLIVANTEFTRGITPLGVDNSDGETQGIMLIGSNIKGNYYGSFDLSAGSSGNGIAYGFDPVTGASQSGTTKNSTLAAYQTVRTLLGLPTSFGDQQGIFKAMMRSG